MCITISIILRIRMYVDIHVRLLADTQNYLRYSCTAVLSYIMDIPLLDNGGVYVRMYTLICDPNRTYDNLM